MKPKNKKEKKSIDEIIEDDIIDVDEIIEDEFDRFYDYEIDSDNYDGFKKMLDYQKRTGYFYPDNDDEELIIDDEYGHEDDEIENFEEKLDRTYKSYYEAVVEKGSDENE